MKRFLTSLSIIALSVGTPFPVFAQSPDAKPGVGTSALGGGGGATTAAPVGAMTFSCEVPEMKLEEAVDLVTTEAEKRGLVTPNTLFAPGAAEIRVPRLKLRSVTPSGALSLLAAAAGCEVEQISAPDGVVSGWMFRSRPAVLAYDPFQSVPSGPGVLAYDPFQSAPGGFTAIQPTPAGSAQPAGASPAGTGLGGLADVPIVGKLFRRTSGAEAATIEEPVAPPVNQPGPGDRPGATSPEGSVVVGYGGGAAAASPMDTLVTRVYPVAALLDTSKPDSEDLVQKALLQALETAYSDETPGSPKPPKKLSFHDGAKLLVVKATRGTQAFIEETLQAMKQNVIDSKGGRPRVNDFRQLPQGEGAAGATGGGAPPPSAQPARGR